MWVVLSCVLGVVSAITQGPVTPADTFSASFSNLAQSSFPHRTLTAKDHRRILSSHQQTQILDDVRQHHRFQPTPTGTNPHVFPHTQLFNQLQLPLEQGTTHFSQQAHLSNTGLVPQSTEPRPNFHVELQESISDSETIKQQLEQEVLNENKVREENLKRFRLAQEAQLKAAQERLKQESEEATLQPLDLLRKHFSQKQPLKVNATEKHPSQLLNQQKITTTTTPTTTTEPVISSKSSTRYRLLDEEQLFLPTERQQLFKQLKEAHIQEQRQLNQSRLASFRKYSDERLQVEQSQSARKTPHQIIDQDYKSRYVKPLSAQEQQRQLQDQLRKQFQVQLIQRQDLLKRLKEVVIDSKTPINKDQVEPRPLVLPTNSSIPIYLADGPKFQAIQQSNKNVPFSIPKGYEIKSVEVPTSSLSKGTSRSTSTPPKAIFDDLTKGVLPPGTNYEVIHQKQDGGLEEVGKLPQNLPEKKVTFVFLEEQPDGTVKVQGVRGNGEEGDKVKPSGVEVESILKKLKEGDLKLPPSTKLSSSPSDASSFLGTSQQESINSPSYISQSPRNSVLFSTTPTPTSASLPSASQNSPIPYLGFGNNGFPPSHTHFAQTTNMDFLPSVTAATPSQGTFSSFSSTPSVNTFSAQSPTPVTPNSPYSVNVNSYDQSSSSDFQQGIPSYDEQNLGQDTRSAYPQQPVQVNNQQTFPPPQPPLSPQYQNIYNSFQQFSSTPPPAVQYSATTNNPDTFPNKQYFSPSGVPVQNNNQNSHLQFLPTIPTNDISPISQYPNLSSSSTPARYQPPIISFNPPVISSSTSSNNGIDAGEFDSQRYVDTVGDDISTQKPKKNPKNRFRVARPQKEDEPIPELEEEDVKVDTRPSLFPPVSLTQTLKQQGLYAMARYLRESGLDNILNDTGPYTVFVPTDKAFRALLVQLGGPEMADEKFRENPRLLSGLLLHHVIPGAFRLNTLQDEMTGVSLAGTQLRVNTYSTQDVEWNDVQVVTINGARVSRAKHDLIIPQGIAHAIDRVMFPLPVGNVLQTLQSDREHRFNQFLRVVHSANLESVLAGSKMHTVFAPTDKALNTLTSEDLEKIISDQVLSRALVHRHVSPGTLYSAGMRFYQIRDSLERGQQITINKSAGQVKVNNANVVTHNIPATNGVIHAVDGLI